MRPGTRLPVYSCSTPETYKYFVRPKEIQKIWDTFSSRFGPLKNMPGFGIRQIDSDEFILRAGPTGNPITAIRRHSCTSNSVATLHRIVGFEADPTETVA